MKNVNYKKLILPNIPYVFIALFATKLGQAARLTPGTDFSSKALNFMQGLTLAFENIMPSFHPIDLLVGVAAAVIIRLVVYFKGKNAKKFRKNLEYGSARWGTREDIAPFMDPVFENNIILTQTESLNLDAPWRPGDLEQRSGRIIRQGNMNPEVHIYRYVTEATFDAYLWQTLENKQMTMMLCQLVSLNWRQKKKSFLRKLQKLKIVSPR